MRVLALGIGGAGSRIVDILQEQDERSKVGCISAIAVDTDANSLAALEHLSQNARLYFPFVQLDGETFPSSFEIGEIMARIQLMNRDFDAVLVCSGLGGTLSSSLEKVIKTIRSSLPEPVYALVTLPCRSEGKKISAKAAEDIEILNEIADAVIFFDNETWYNKIRSMMAVIEKTKSDVESRAEGIVPFRRITQEEVFYLLNDRIARQLGLILRAGEFDEYGVEVGEVVLDAGEIINTLQSTRGAAAIGYAIEELPKSALEKLSFFSRSSTSNHAEDENQRAARIISLAKTAVYEDISIPCDLTSADKALILIAGPSHEISMKGFYSVKKWIDRSISGIEMRSGDYPVANTHYIGLIIMLAGLQNVPRIEELKLIREDLQREKERERRVIEDKKREESRRKEEERMQDLARQRELERQKQEEEARNREKWEHEKTFYEEDQAGWTLVEDVEFLLESSDEDMEHADESIHEEGKVDFFDVFEEVTSLNSLEDEVELLAAQRPETIRNTGEKPREILQPEDVADLLEDHVDTVPRSDAYPHLESGYEDIGGINTETPQLNTRERTKTKPGDDYSSIEHEIRTDKITLSIPSSLEGRYNEEPLERDNSGSEFSTDRISVQAKVVDPKERLSMDLPSRAEKKKQDMLRMTSIGNTDKPKDSVFDLRTVSLDKVRPRETMGTDMTGNLNIKKSKGPNDSVFSSSGMKLDKGYGSTKARDGVFGASGVKLHKNIAPKDSSIDGSSIKVGGSSKTKELIDREDIRIKKNIMPHDSALEKDDFSVYKHTKAKELLNDDQAVHISKNTGAKELLEGESVGMRQGVRPKELLSEKPIKAGSVTSARELLSSNKIRAGSTAGAKELLEGNVPSSGLRERPNEVKEAFSRPPPLKTDIPHTRSGADELLARSKRGLEIRKTKTGVDMPPSRRLKVIENIQMNVKTPQSLEKEGEEKTQKSKKDSKSSLEWY